MDAEARERRVRLRDEERARRLQGGQSIYDQSRPAASPPTVVQEERPKTAISDYADQIFEEMMRKGGNLGEKTLAGMLPPARYEPAPKPINREPKPPDKDPVPLYQAPVSRPQTAPKLSKEQYKSELLAQIEQERKRKELEKAALKGIPTDLNPVLPKPHVKKQDPNRPSAGNPVAEMFRPQTAAPPSVPAVIDLPRSPIEPCSPGQSLMDIDVMQGGWAEPPLQGRRVEDFEYEKAKLIYERQQAKEELLRAKEEMLNEKERRLNQLMQMMQVRQMMPPVYTPLSPAPTPPIPQAHLDLLELPVERVKAPAPYIPPRKIPPSVPVEASLRSSSKLISPEVYRNPSSNLLLGDHSPYESMLNSPKMALQTPRNEVPLPIRTSLIEQFPDMASEATLTLPESGSILSSAREIQLSEPRYGVGDSQSVVSSRETLRNEYENNFESALLQNFSLSNEWKGTETAKSVSSMEEDIAPYESEGENSQNDGENSQIEGENSPDEEENSPNEGITPPPTTYTRQLLLEYRKQRYFLPSAKENLEAVLKPIPTAPRKSSRYALPDPIDE